jgi:peptidoglycan/LPS O-acetylase OafA/YrhL
LAILGVVAFHCGVPGFAGGFVGVDVFFVLSGYLITGLLVEEVLRTGRISLLNFYARRMRRLLPASAFVLMITLVIGAIILSPGELLFAGRAARATAVYASNIFFASNAADYFAPDVETNPLLHTWTLAVEEQFYLFCPLAIVFGLQICRSRKVLAQLLVGIVTLSLGISIWQTGHGGAFAFYGLPARAWEFAVGGLASLIQLQSTNLRGLWEAIGAGGFVTVLAGFHWISDPVAFPGWIAVVPVLGTTASLVSAAGHPAGVASRVLRSPILKRIGTLSYSWYLWHWPMLVYVTLLFPHIGVFGKLGTCLAALGIASVTHSLIENPVRFSPWLTQRPAASLALGSALTVCSLTAAFTSLHFADYLSNTPEIKEIAAKISDIADMSRDQCLSSQESSDLKTCVFGDPGSANNIVLFGDSHARQWFNPLRRIVVSHGWKLTTLVREDCPAVDISPPDLTPALASKCLAWRHAALRSIGQMRPSAVFVGSATYYLGHNEDKSGKVISLAEWRKGTRRTLQALSALGLKVIYVRDNPFPPFDVPKCLERMARNTWYPPGSCEIKRQLAVDPAIFEAEKSGATGISGIHFVDLTEKFCTGEICPAIQQNILVYRDDNHLTGGYAETLTPELAAKVVPIVNSAQSKQPGGAWAPSTYPN